MIELVEGFWVDPFQVTVVKALGEKKCALWVYGQSAMDGFVLDYSADDVTRAIIDAREEQEQEADPDEDEDQEEE